MQIALFNSLFFVLNAVAKRTHVGRVGDIMNYTNARLDDKLQAQADDKLGGGLRLYRVNHDGSTAIRSLLRGFFFKSLSSMVYARRMHGRSQIWLSILPNVHIMCL